MQISIANAIQVARRIGAAAAEVITTNLKMWLGFETSETLGREEVVNGDYTQSGVGNAISQSGGILVNDNNRLKITSNGFNGYSRAVWETNGSQGEVFKIKADVISITGGTRFINISDNVGASLVQGETFETTITLGSAAKQVGFGGSNDTSFELILDNVSVKQLTQITPDKSGNNNVGELFTGKALEFDGNVDSVTFSSYPTSIKSVVFWYKPLASAPFDAIIWLGGTNRGTISISNNQGTINCTNLLGKVVYVNGVQTDSVALNVWQRVVINFPSKTLLGLNFAKSGLNYGNCQLSDIQFYNENLSLDDIAYDYANPQNLLTDREGTSVLLADLRGYWHLSEGAGLTVYDSSGGSHSGAINGATYEPVQPRIPQLGMMNWSKPTIGSNVVTLIPDPNNTSQDIFGNAVRDRLNSFNLGKFGGARVDDIAINGSQATIQLWFKNVNSNDSLYLADIHSATDRIVLGFNSSQLSAYHEITGAWQNFGIITDGDWNFATFTFNGTSLKCFVGTSQLGATKTISAINIGTTEQFGIGMNHYFPSRTQDYNGHISDFLLYDRVLTSGEIENNYNAGLSAHTND